MKLKIVILTVCLLCVSPVFANTVGFIYQSAANEDAWGLNGDYEADITDVLKFGAEGQLQSGDAYAGDLDLALTLGNDNLGIRLESNNTFTGYALAKMGRNNDLGVSLVFPIAGVEVSGGIFGKNGNPFEPIYELENPSDPNSAVLKDDGILIKEGSSLNLALRTELEFGFLGRDVEAGLRGLFEVAGEGEKVHQGTIDLETGGQLDLGLNWKIQGQFTVQAWGENITWQRSILAGIDYGF